MWLLLTWLACAGGDDSGSPGAGSPDGGSSDGGAPDGGASDGGASPDGGTADGGGTTDGGTADGGAATDGGATDGGTDTTGDCGQALFTASDGGITDLTAAFTTGEETTLSQDGRLEVCTGTWFVILRVEAQVEVVGLGSGPERTVLSGGDWGTVVEVAGEGARVQVENVTLDRGSARGHRNDRAGAGLRCTEGASAALSQVIVSNGQAYDGGGVYGEQGCVIEVEGAVFRDNTTTDDGGGLRVDDSTAVIRDSRFEGNQARDGGALFAWNSAVSLHEVEFQDNTATDTQGGAVLHYFGGLDITGGAFRGNDASQVGGALSLFGDTTLSGVAFEGNEADAGGAIYLYTSEATLACEACTFAGNLPDDVGLDLGSSHSFEGPASFTCDGAGCR
ncbi:right-handed parallel beta-helix repeat-containing protein [Myxococcota bacterium]|nr:right-handed parallel beta-helix repeat-containing protein [Myxococcota bacterium]